jgi:F-type H+-transporting ATPase subunit alpha
MPDGRVRQQLTRGARIRAILRQPQHMPFRLVDEIGLVLAVQSGLLDPLPLDAVATFCAGLPAMLDTDASEVMSTLAETGALSSAAHATLMAAITRFAATLSSGKQDTSVADKLESAVTP